MHRSNPPAGATTVEVWNLDTMSLHYAVTEEDAVYPLFLDDPPRLVLMSRNVERAITTYGERIRVYDAETGRFLHETDLTPRETLP